MAVFLDIPVEVSLRPYEMAVDHAVEILSGIEGIKSVYRIGGFSAPGISDIDLVVVFKDEFVFKDDIRSFLSDDERYLFIHRLYGIPEKYFLQPESRAFFHHYKLLSGKSYELNDPS